MCYAGGPYCYSDSYVSYAKARDEFDDAREEYMNLSDAQREHEFDRTGTIPDPQIDESEYKDAQDRLDSASRSLWNSQAKVRSTRESVEESQLNTLRYGTPRNPAGGEVVDAYSVGSQERARILSSSALREHISAQTNISRSKVNADQITLESNKRMDKMTYTDEEGNKIYQENFPAGESFKPEAGDKPSMKRVSYADDHTLRKQQVGHVVDDGFGNVDFHPDGETASVALMREGKPYKRGWYNLRESSVPTAKNPAVTKHHHASYEKSKTPKNARQEAYQAVEKANPGADKRTKEIRARLYDSMEDTVKYRQGMDTAKDKTSREKASLLYIRKRSQSGQLLSAYKETDEWKNQEAQNAHTDLSARMMGRIKG